MYTIHIFGIVFLGHPVFDAQLNKHKITQTELNPPALSRVSMVQNGNYSVL